MSLQLLDDIFSVNATLQSNQALQHLVLDSLDTEEGIQTHIDMSTEINVKHKSNPARAGVRKASQKSCIARKEQND